MNLDNYNILKGIVKELRRELTELENEIQYNLRCMKEADIYVHSFVDEESAFLCPGGMYLCMSLTIRTGIGMSLGAGIALSGITLI